MYVRTYVCTHVAILSPHFNITVGPYGDDRIQRTGLLKCSNEKRAEDKLRQVQCYGLE